MNVKSALEKKRQNPNIPIMKNVYLIGAACLMLGGCLQKQAAPIEYRGQYFFGKEGAYDKLGNELPKYSSYNPAPESEYHADKFVGQEERYGVSAEISDVSSSDIAPPEPIESSPLASEPLQEVRAYEPQQEPVESVTVTAPELETSSVDIPEQTPPPANTATTKFIWPLRGEIISRYGTTLNGQRNDGINIKAREGEPIRASADGVVAYADDEIKAFGNMAIIQHPGGYLSAYAHASELVIKKGDQIVKGQLIGFVGKTGNVNTAQLHYSIRKDKSPVDPMGLLSND